MNYVQVEIRSNADMGGGYRDFIAELTDIAKANGGMIEPKKAAERGISKAMLSKLYSRKGCSGSHTL